MPKETIPKVEAFSTMKHFMRKYNLEQVAPLDSFLALPEEDISNVMDA